MNIKRKFLFVATAIAVCVVLTSSAANARPDGDSATRTATLNTIGVGVGSSDHSYCSQVIVSGLQAWQCTPVLAATASAFHPTGVSTGGTLSFTGTATCEYREKSDGIDNDWGAWASCGPLQKVSSRSRSWAALGAPYGETIRFEWPRVLNVDTWGPTDCVEIRTSIRTAADVSNAVERTSLSLRFPSFGTNLSGICEGSSAY